MRLAKLVSWILVISGMLYLALGLVYLFITLRPSITDIFSSGSSAAIVSHYADLFFKSLSAIGLGVLLVDMTDSPITRMRKWLEFNDG